MNLHQLYFRTRNRFPDWKQHFIYRKCTASEKKLFYVDTKLCPRTTLVQYLNRLIFLHLCFYEKVPLELKFLMCISSSVTRDDTKENKKIATLFFTLRDYLYFFRIGQFLCHAFLVMEWIPVFDFPYIASYTFIRTATLGLIYARDILLLALEAQNARPSNYTKYKCCNA